MPPSRTNDTRNEGVSRARPQLSAEALQARREKVREDTEAVKIAQAGMANIRNTLQENTKKYVASVSFTVGLMVFFNRSDLWVGRYMLDGEKKNRSRSQWSQFCAEQYAIANESASSSLDIFTWFIEGQQIGHRMTSSGSKTFASTTVRCSVINTVVSHNQRWDVWL